MRLDGTCASSLYAFARHAALVMRTEQVTLSPAILFAVAPYDVLLEQLMAVRGSPTPHIVVHGALSDFAKFCLSEPIIAIATGSHGSTSLGDARSPVVFPDLATSVLLQDLLVSIRLWEWLKIFQTDRESKFEQLAKTPKPSHPVGIAIIGPTKRNFAKSQSAP